MKNKTENKADNAAFVKTRDYFLGQSLKPSDKVPDLLAENRKIAVELAEQVMSLIDVIAKYFGIPTMDLAMAALPEVSLQLEADGVREKAAARTYLDLRGSVPLSDICKGTYAYPVPTLHCVAQEILRRDRFATYAPNDPLLKRIFGVCDKAERKNVFNGEIGEIIEVQHTRERALIVQYPSKTIPYAEKDLEDLELAYALTVHKCQGSEFGVVIIPVAGEGNNRRSLYTAVTRGRKLVLQIGTESALTAEMRDESTDKRASHLAIRLQRLLPPILPEMVQTSLFLN